MPVSAMAFPLPPSGASGPSLADELRSLGGVQPRFQPILDLQSGGAGRGRYRLRGLECLSRGPRGSRFESAADLFGAARHRGEILELDRTCIETGLRALQPLPVDVDLFLNVHASTLEEAPDLRAFLERRAASAGLAPERLVVEIIEAQPVANASAFQVAISRLRRAGIRIALDDIGQGHATNRMVLAVRPDFIKLDRFVVRGVYFDVHRRALASSYAHMARELGIATVAEGVESRTQLRALRELGIELCQGFLFARPMSVAGLRRAGLVGPGAAELAPSAGEEG